MPFSYYEWIVCLISIRYCGRKVYTSMCVCACVCVIFAFTISKNGHYMRRDKWQVLILSINKLSWMKNNDKNYVPNMTLCKIESIYLVWLMIILLCMLRMCVHECVWVMLSKMFTFAVKWNQLEINRQFYSQDSTRWISLYP